MTGVPLLIYANKQDLTFSMDPDEIMDLINLNNIKDRQWTIVACSALTKIGNIIFSYVYLKGLQDGMNWLVDVLK